jgi:ABC-type methionine transport system permease subunit
MKELKQVCELVGYIIGAIISLPFIILSLILIYIFKAFEALWKNPER